MFVTAAPQMLSKTLETIGSKKYRTLDSEFYTRRVNCVQDRLLCLLQQTEDSRRYAVLFCVTKLGGLITGKCPYFHLVSAKVHNFRR